MAKVGAKWLILAAVISVSIADQTGPRVELPRLNRAMSRGGGCKPFNVDETDPTVAQRLLHKVFAVSEWRLKTKESDMVVYEELTKGIPLLGGTMTFLMQDGEVQSVFGKIYSRCNLKKLVPKDRDVYDSALKYIQDMRSALGGDPHSLVYETELVIDPVLEKPIVFVSEKSVSHWWQYWVDMSGVEDLINAYSYISFAAGTGVFGQRRNLDGLTSFFSPLYYLEAKSRRQVVWDGQYSRNQVFPATDPDDQWVDFYQREQVDAQYWMSKVDDYLMNVFSYDYIEHYRAMEAVVHLTRNRSSAFWNGQLIVFGEGDGGATVKPTAGDEDIVAHEIAHAVSDSYVNLIKQDYSGAISESFSDIFAMGFSYNLYRSADWVIAEKSFVGSRGVRNMKNPLLFGHPSHALDVELIGSTQDNGGVHRNAGVVNHWFYLLVEGGVNAKASRRTGVRVTGIGMAKAIQIVFRAFVGIPRDAGFCDVRQATVNIANWYGFRQNAMEAWDEVGVSFVECSQDFLDFDPTPEPPAETDKCEGLCSSGTRKGDCVSFTRKNGNVARYCLYCDDTFRRTGSKKDCCQKSSTYKGCANNNNLSVANRCKAENNRSILNKFNNKLTSSQFANKRGSICYTYNNFKLHNGMCRVTKVAGKWKCDFNVAKREAQKALGLL